MERDESGNLNCGGIVYTNIATGFQKFAQAFQTAKK